MFCPSSPFVKWFLFDSSEKSRKSPVAATKAPKACIIQGSLIAMPTSASNCQFCVSALPVVRQVFVVLDYLMGSYFTWCQCQFFGCKFSQNLVQEMNCKWSMQLLCVTRCDSWTCWWIKFRSFVLFICLPLIAVQFAPLMSGHDFTLNWVSESKLIDSQPRIDSIFRWAPDGALVFTQNTCPLSSLVQLVTHASN